MASSRYPVEATIPTGRGDREAEELDEVSADHREWMVMAGMSVLRVLPEQNITRIPGRWLRPGDQHSLIARGPAPVSKPEPFRRAEVLSSRAISAYALVDRRRWRRAGDGCIRKPPP